MIETLQSLYVSRCTPGMRRIALTQMTKFLVRDDRLGNPSQLARQFILKYKPRDLIRASGSTL